MKTVELKRQLGWLKTSKRFAEYRGEDHLAPYYEQALEALKEQIRWQEQHQPFTSSQWKRKLRRW